MTARKKERLKEALESQQAEDYWNSDAHYGQYYRRDKQAKAKQLALQQAPEKERMRALRDQADANFLKAYLATGGERAADPLGDGGKTGTGGTGTTGTGTTPAAESAAAGTTPEGNKGVAAPAASGIT